MSLEKSVSSVAQCVVKPVMSLLKVALRSKRPSARVGSNGRPDRALIVMGNGPSLRSFLEFIAESPSLRASCALEAVNFAAITPEFFTLRPEFYVMADPHFFNPDSGDGKVEQLWAALRRCDWPMTLWLPLQHKRAAMAMLRREGAEAAGYLNVKWMNLTPVDGSGPLADRLIHSGLGMPRPRNVLIPAIICGIREGFSEIYIVGADHSWSRTLSVDDENHVVSVQPHFYKDDEKEKARVHAEYAGYHLHDILNSLTIAFRSYFDIRRYASRRGIRIINATPESFIDAFPRCNYAQIPQRSKP